MMDVEEAQAIIARSDYHIDNNGHMNSELIDAINTVFEALERTRWIPVSERLPTEKDANTNGLVHVWLKDGNCDYEDWQDVARYAEVYQHITHWMPLPKPPEVE